MSALHRPADGDPATEPDTPASEPITFQAGRYYQHGGRGRLLHVISATKTTLCGQGLLAEDREGSLIQGGTHEDNASGYREVSEQVWLDAWGIDADGEQP